jgi:uncharacterized protein
MRVKSRPFGAHLAGIFLLTGAIAYGADHAALETAATISVSGTGEVLLEPDEATLTIAVDSDASTSAAAASDNSRATDAVRSALAGAGAALADISTASYVVQPRWQYSSNTPPRRVGYSAHNTLRVSVAHLAELGRWIDVALEAGASRVDSIELDSKEAPSARQAALARAFANARQDAETLAKAAGGRLGSLQEVTTEASNVPRPMLPIAAAAPVSRAETHIEPSALHIQAVITARWRFEP